MTSTNFKMWPHWRDKHYNLVDALKDYYPEVLASEMSLRQELIRIEAYEALIDKIMDPSNGSKTEVEERDSARWRYQRENYGYEQALQRHYESELENNEALRVALENIIDAKAFIDKWMNKKGGHDHSVVQGAWMELR